jgi:hypothetical protein
MLGRRLITTVSVCCRLETRGVGSAACLLASMAATSGSSSVLQSPVYLYSFYVTAVLVENGDILLSYFDGNSGAGACWEYSGGTTAPVAQGGTSPGVSRSYYY